MYIVKQSKYTYLCVYNNSTALKRFVFVGFSFLVGDVWGMEGFIYPFLKLVYGRILAEENVESKKLHCDTSRWYFA